MNRSNLVVEVTPSDGGVAMLSLYERKVRMDTVRVFWKLVCVDAL